MIDKNKLEIVTDATQVIVKVDEPKVEEEPVDDSEYANEIDEEIETDKKTGDSVPEEDLPF